MANFYNDMDKFMDLFLYLFPKYINNIDKINFLGTDYINNNSKSINENPKQDVKNTTQSAPKTSVKENSQKNDKNNTLDKTNSPKINTTGSGKATTNPNSKTNDNKSTASNTSPKLSDGKSRSQNSTTPKTNDNKSTVSNISPKLSDGKSRSQNSATSKTNDNKSVTSNTSPKLSDSKTVENSTLKSSDKARASNNTRKSLLGNPQSSEIKSTDGALKVSDNKGTSMSEPLNDTSNYDNKTNLKEGETKSMVEESSNLPLSNSHAHNDGNQLYNNVDTSVNSTDENSKLLNTGSTKNLSQSSPNESLNNDEIINDSVNINSSEKNLLNYSENANNSNTDEANKLLALQNSNLNENLDKTDNSIFKEVNSNGCCMQCMDTLKDVFQRLINENVNLSINDADRGLITNSTVVSVENSLIKLKTPKNKTIIVPICEVVAVKANIIASTDFSRLNNVNTYSNYSFKCEDIEKYFSSMIDRRVFIQTKGIGEFRYINNKPISKVGRGFVIVDQNIFISLCKINLIEELGNN